MIADAIHNGILYPMAQGDGEAVREQFFALKKGVEGGELFIFGLEKKVIYSSEAQKEKGDMLKEVRSPELAAAIQDMLQTCKTADRLYEESIEG